MLSPKFRFETVSEIVSVVPETTLVKDRPLTFPSSATQQLSEDSMRRSTLFVSWETSTTVPAATLPLRLSSVPFTWNLEKTDSLPFALAAVADRPDIDVTTSAKMVSSERRFDLNNCFVLY
jgi:hypothetical protein